MLYLTIGDVGSFAAASKMLYEGGATIADIPQAHDAAAGAGQHGELRWRIAPWTGVRMDSVSVTLEYWCTKPPQPRTRKGCFVHDVVGSGKPRYSGIASIHLNKENFHGYGSSLDSWGDAKLF